MRDGSLYKKVFILHPTTKEMKQIEVQVISKKMIPYLLESCHDALTAAHLGKHKVRFTV